MALALRPIWRASFNFTTSQQIVAAAWAVTPAGTSSTAVYPYPSPFYSVGTTKAALIKSIVLTNVSSQDLVIAGVYTGFRTTFTSSTPPVSDLTTAPTNGVCLFQRIAPKDLRVPAGQQIVLDTEVVMMGMNITNAVPTAHSDNLIFVTGALASGTVTGGIECVVNGAERDQV